MSRRGRAVSAWLARAAGGTLECTWLAAAALAPLAFNLASERTFEPDKAHLVRALALVAAASWLVKLVAEGGLSRRADGSLPRGAWLAPLLAAIALHAASGIVSTWLGHAPRLSWWGSYQRGRGTYTELSLILIGLAAATHATRAVQSLRLERTLVLAALPVALFAGVQRLGLDPRSWGGDVDGRVTSTLGNPMFLGTYLVPVAFLALQRAAAGYFARPRRTAAALLYGAVFCAQALALLWTGTRGAGLGFLAGAFVFLLLVPAGRAVASTRRWRTAVLLAGLAGAGGLGWLAAGPLPASLSEHGLLERWTRLFDARGGSGRARVLLWESSAQIVGSTRALPRADGSVDPRPALRPWIGHGPGAMPLAFAAVYPPELGRIAAHRATADHPHNEAWDALVSRGVLGLASTLLLWVTLGLRLLHRLQWLQAPRDVVRVVACIAGGGAGAGLVVLVVDGSWRFAVPAMVLGGVAGLLPWLLRRGTGTPEAAPPASTRWLTVGVLAALVGHVVDAQFAFSTVTSRVLFWLLVALALLPEVPTRATAKGNVAGRLAGDVFLCLALGFLFGGTPLGGALLVVTAAFLAATAAAESASARRSRVLVVAASIAGGCWLLAAAVRGLPGDASAFGRLAWTAIAGTIVLGAFLGREEREERAAGGGILRALAAVVVCAAAGMAAWAGAGRWNLDRSRADEVFRSARDLDAAGRLDAAIGAYSTALATGGLQDHYLLFLERALVARARATPPSSRGPDEDPVPPSLLALRGEGVARATRSELLRLAEAALVEGARLNPANLDHAADLARLYRAWGSLAPSPEERERLERQSIEQYERVLSASPARAVVWCELGDLLAARGQGAEAERTLLRARDLDPAFGLPHHRLGALYLDLGRTADLGAAMELGLAARPEDATMWSYLGIARARSGDTRGAIAANLEVVARRPGDPRSLRNLALLHVELGDRRGAIEWGTRAAEAVEGRLGDPESDGLAREMRSLVRRLAATERPLAGPGAGIPSAPSDPAPLP